MNRLITKLCRKLRRAHKSLTIQFNALMATVVGVLPQLLDALPSLQPHLGPEFYKWVAIVTIVGNSLIRGRTAKPLEEK
jgi:hypothetical protein